MDFYGIYSFLFSDIVISDIGFIHHGVQELWKGLLDHELLCSVDTHIYAKDNISGAEHQL